MCLRLYLLLAALRVLLPILGFSQQVGEGQRFEGAGAGGPGIPERVVVPRVPPAPDRAQRARAHAARGVDAVDADHLGGLSRDPTDKKSPNFLCFLYRRSLGRHSPLPRNGAADLTKSSPLMTAGLRRFRLEPTSRASRL